MKVFFDHQAFSLQKFGGISRIFLDIMNLFDNTSEISVKSYFPYSYNEYIQDEVKNPSKFLESNNLIFKKLSKNLLVHVNNFLTAFKLNKMDFDVFVPTYYYPYFLKHLKGRPYVLLVHDMIHEIFPELIGKFDFTSANKKKLIQNTQYIWVSTENTKKDILKFFPEVNPEHITVVSVSRSLEPKISQDVLQKLPKKYILFVGNRNKYKNFQIVLSSFVKLNKDFKDLHLLCVGGGPFTQDELKKINDSGVQHSVIQMNVEEGDLYTIYKNAELFVFSSKYEGFGIPILEAFQSECPTILSNSSCFPEIAQDAVLYFDADDENMLYNQMKKVVEDDQLKKELIEKGKKRYQNFSEEKRREFISNYFMSNFQTSNK